MNQPNDQGRSSEPSSASKWTGGWRFALLAGGLFVIALLVTAWFGGIGRSAAPTTQPAGVSYDIEKARAQTQDLQARVMQAISHKQDVDMIPQARELVAHYPRFAPAHTLLAQLYISQSQFKEAYQSLDMSLRLDSQQPQVQQLAGTVAQALGKQEEASRHFAQAVGQDPGNGRYRVYLAQTYIEQQRFDDAKMTLLAALHIDSDLHEAYYALSTLDARQGHLDQAIVQAQRAIDHLPADNEGPRVAYGRWESKLMVRDNRPADALQVLDKLDDKARRSPPVLEDMAIAWQMLGKPERGAALYEEALAHQSDQWPLALGAARWYLKANDKPNARRMVDALRRINPSAPALAELTQQVQ